MINVYSTHTVTNQHEAETRHRLRIDCNGNAGDNPNSGTLFLQSPGCQLKDSIRYASNLLAYPFFARLVWDAADKKIKISYYKDERDCMADRRTLSKKVVSVIWANLYKSPKEATNEAHWRDRLEQQTAIVLSMDQTYTIEQCSTLDEVREVYRMKSLTNGGTGGTSCMCIDPDHKPALRHTRADNGEYCYPCDAWFNDTTRVMRVRDEKGAIVARFVAPMANNYFYSIYAVNGAVAKAIADTLQATGWQKKHNMLEGCRLLIIETDENKVLMPYIDSYPDTMCADGWLGNGSASCNHSDGTASGLSGVICNSCGHSFDEDDTYWCEDDEVHVCERCIDRGRYHWVYARRGDTVLMDANNHYIVEYNGEYYHTDYLDYYDLVVLHDDEIAHSDATVFCEDAGGYYLVDDCSRCPVTGDYFPDGCGRLIDGLGLEISESGYRRIAHRKDGKNVLDILDDIEADSDAEAMAQAVLDQCEYPDNIDSDELERYFQRIIDSLNGDTSQEDADAA